MEREIHHDTVRSRELNRELNVRVKLYVYVGMYTKLMCVCIIINNIIL